MISADLVNPYGISSHAYLMLITTDVTKSYENNKVEATSTSQCNLLQRQEQSTTQIIEQASEEKTIPIWIKNNTDWWSDKIPSDQEFIKGIKWPIAHNIKVN